MSRAVGRRFQLLDLKKAESYRTDQGPFMKTINGSQLRSLLKPECRIFVVGGSNEPIGLCNALREAPECARGVSFLQFPLPGMNTFDYTTLDETTHQETFFLTPDLQENFQARRIDYLPMQMRYIYDYLCRTRLDMAFVQIGYDRDGTLRAGPNVDFWKAITGNARVIVAELNRGMVCAAGAPLVRESDIDYVFESNRSLPQMESAQVDDVAATIGKNVASVIRDGDCLQTGIGAIPKAVLSALQGHNDLGLHGGLIDDAGMSLIQSGVVTGFKKAIRKGVHVAGMALGTDKLYEWLADTPSVEFHSANVTHEIEEIRRLDHFVSINSAVEIDLEGQVNAEVIGGRQISGTGGSVDFMRSARASKGGRSIIAMTATARRGQTSRIVPKVEMVTALRTDIDLVITEFGIADLRNANRTDRLEALVEIAHPDFRTELLDSRL